MLLSRRAALTLTLSALAAPALIRPALAACNPVDMLDSGVTFTRQDGSKGLARRVQGELYVDYVTNRGEWIDRRRVDHGVFEVGRVVQESELPIVGASAPSYTWSYSPRTSWLEDGMSWNGKVREEVEVTISDEWGTVERDRTRWTANYQCFEPREVKLSGCTYKALSVEATFVGEKGSRSQRWVYFPDLRLGLETRRDGVTNGITALTPV